MRKVLYILLLNLLPLSVFAQSATNVTATQVGKKIIVTYFLDKEADVELLYTTNYLNQYSFLHCYSVSGDVGKNVSPGTRSITWDVTQDMDKLIGDGVYFKVVADESSNAKVKRTKQVAKEAKMRGIYPWGGFDVFVGYPNIGMTAFIRWNGYRPHRWGIFMDYSYGIFAMDKNTNWQNGHALHIGPEVMLARNCCLFFGPGIAWQKEFYQTTKTSGSGSYYSYNYTTTSSDYKPKFSFRAGIGGNLSLFALSAYISYPWAIGVGMGLVL